MPDSAVAQGVPDGADSPSTKELLSLLHRPCLAVMLYGSVARGAGEPGSDIDVLQVVPEPTEHYSVERVSVATYTPEQLSRMSEQGSLFALHLLEEGRMLEDRHGVLAAILSAYQRPSSYRSLWRHLDATAAILDAPSEIVSRNVAGFTRLSLYLLRTAAILVNLEKTGHPLFAIRELGAALQLPELPELFEGRDVPQRLDLSRFVRARAVLQKLLGHDILNSHGSLEALAVNEERTRPVAAALALRLLAGEHTLGYGDLLLDPELPGV